MSAQPRKFFKDYRSFVERVVSGSGREALEDFDIGSILMLRGEVDVQDESVSKLAESVQGL